MEVQFYTEITEFFKQVKPFLNDFPVENNLIYGILERIVKNPQIYGEDAPVLALVRDHDNIVLVSIRTPPWNTILSYTEHLDAVDAFTEELAKKDPQTPGILGPKPAVQRFKHIWVELKNAKVEMGMNERIYKLTEVNPETIGDHEFIIARRKHKSLIRQWGYEFIKEALPETPLEQIERSLDRVAKQIDQGKIYFLLDNGKPVSMVRDASMEYCGRINYVYTPPELRKRGYATECVAKISKKLLETYDYCVLFTDLANPTSNSIYQTIGYKPIIDIDLYSFK